MSGTKRIRLLLRGVVGIIGFLIAATAILMLWAWHTNHYGWIQAGNVSWAPVQYNSALSFLLMGIAVVVLTLDRFRMALLGAGLALTLGSLTLMEYASQRDFGIDQVFFHSELLVQTSHAGRMSPNSALALVLGGIALVLRCSLLSSVRRLRWLGAIGFLISLFGIIALWGYASGIEAGYGWGMMTRMSAISAGLFILLGVSVMLLALEEAILLQARLLEAFPITAVVVLFFGTLMLWSALKEEQRQRREELTEEVKGRFIREFKQRIENAGEMLLQMGERWEVRGGIPQAEWNLEAAGYLRRESVFQAVEWLDTEGLVRWIVPLEGNEAAQNKNLQSEPNRERALSQAKISHSICRSLTVDLLQGGKGFLLVMPLSKRGVFDGYLVGVVRISHLVDQIFAFMGSGYEVELREEGASLLSGPALGDEEGYLAIGVVDLCGMPLEIRVRQVQEFRGSIEAYFPEMALIAGMAGSILVGLLAFLFLRSHRHAAQLQVVNQQLQTEVSERCRAEEVGEQRNRDLETLLYVISHDLREPLRGIESFSRLVYERYVDRLDEKGQDFLRRIVFASMRLDRLLDDVFMLSRAQKIDRPSETIESRELVMEALSRLETKIRISEARITVARDLPALHVNRVWGTQAVFNLLVNALKFSKEGVPPEIEVTAYRDVVKSQMGLVVRDRGVGVKPEHRDRIFKLFQRAVGREVEGNGAGLAIVRQIAERHGGQAWCEPRPGGGTSFFVTFGWVNEKWKKVEEADETGEDSSR